MSLFGDYYDASGNRRGTGAYTGNIDPSCTGDTCGTGIALRTPAVLAAAKLHSGCSSLTSAAIEDNGGSGACAKRRRRWRWWGGCSALAALALPPFFSHQLLHFHIFTGTAGSHWEYRQFMVRWSLGGGRRRRRPQRPPPRTAYRAHLCAKMRACVTNIMTVTLAQSRSLHTPLPGRHHVRRSAVKHARQEVAALQHDNVVGGGHRCVLFDARQAKVQLC